MTAHISPVRQVNDLDECIGCGGHSSEPCHRTCPFESGRFSTPVILRAAAERLGDYHTPAGVDLAAAVRSAARALVGPTHGDQAAITTCSTLAAYLVVHRHTQPMPTNIQTLTRFGHRTHPDDIHRVLYAAAGASSTRSPVTGLAQLIGQAFPTNARRGDVADPPPRPHAAVIRHLTGLRVVECAR